MNQYVEFIDLENSAPLQGMPTANEDRKGGNSEGKGQESSVVSDVANLFGDGSFQDNNATSQSHASIFAENQGTNIDFGTGFQAINKIERKNSGSFVDSSSDNSWNIKTENVSSSSSTSSNSLTDLDPLHPQTNINMTSNHTSFSSSSSDQSHNINHLDESLSILDGDDLLSNGSFIDRIALESFGADHGSQQVPSQYYGEAAYQYAYDQNGELVTVPVRPTYYNTIPTYQQYSTNLTYTKTKKPKAKKASKSKVKRTSSHDGHGELTPRGYNRNRMFSSGSSVSTASFVGSVDSSDANGETPVIKRRGPGRPPNKLKKLLLEEARAEAPPVTPRGGRLSSENVIMKLRRAQKEQEELMLMKARAAEERRVMRAGSEDGLRRACATKKSSVSTRVSEADVRKLEEQMRPRIKGRFVSRKIYDDFTAASTAQTTAPIVEVTEGSADGNSTTNTDQTAVVVVENVNV